MAMAVAMEAVEVAEVVEAVAVAAAAVVAAVEGVGLLLVAMGPLEATMAITLMPLVPFKVRHITEDCSSSSEYEDF